MTVDFVGNTLTQTNNDLTSTVIQIKRKVENFKKRNCGWRRHDPMENNNLRQMSTVYYLYETDLEWLSLNWRKYRASRMSKSIRRMFLAMFEHDYQYFPTLREIRD